MSGHVEPLDLDEVMRDWLRRLDNLAGEYVDNLTAAWIDNHHLVARTAVALGAEVPDVGDLIVGDLDNDACWGKL